MGVGVRLDRVPRHPDRLVGAPPLVAHDLMVWPVIGVERGALDRLHALAGAVVGKDPRPAAVGDQDPSHGRLHGARSARLSGLCAVSYLRAPSLRGKPHQRIDAHQSPRPMASPARPHRRRRPNVKIAASGTKKPIPIAHSMM